MVQYRDHTHFIELIEDVIGRLWYLTRSPCSWTQPELIKIVNTLKTEQNLRDMVLYGGWRFYPPACVIVGILKLEKYLDDIASTFARDHKKTKTLNTQKQ